jgi:hypothetical protein
MRLLAALCSVLALTLLLACGSSSSSTSTSAPAPTATSTPPPSSGGTAPSPTPSDTSPDHFYATFFNAIGSDTTTVQGIVQIDINANDGSGIVGYNTASASTFVMQFCPDGGNYTNCFDVTTFNARAGTGTTFTFPRKGTFTGVFVLTQQGTIVNYGGIDNSGGVATGFAAKLLPAGSSSGFGTVTVGLQTTHVTLSGAAPSHTYNVALCTISNCNETVGSITTDAQGNGAVDFPLKRFGFAGYIGLTDSSGRAYVSAFRVQ